MTKSPHTKTAINYSLKPNQELHDDLQRIISHLNYRLFNDELPECLLSLRAGLRTAVCLSPQSLAQRNVHSSPALLFKPSEFKPQPTLEWLATLTKSLVDLWQYYFGRPGRRGYHNREWANKMKSIGLQSSHSGKEGGRETGETMRFYRISGGLFERSAREIQKDGLTLRWQGSLHNEPSAKNGKRIKYQCPICMSNAWAKADFHLVCGKHNEKMLPKN